MTSGSSLTADPVPMSAGEERPRKAACVTDELLPDGSMVLYHACKQRLLTLNATAALVWECCDGDHDLATIAREVREVFPDAPDVETDIITILQSLIAQGLIVDDAL